MSTFKKWFCALFLPLVFIAAAPQVMAEEGGNDPQTECTNRADEYNLSGQERSDYIAGCVEDMRATEQGSGDAPTEEGSSQESQ